MKFLVQCHLDVGRPGPDVVKALAETMPRSWNPMESWGAVIMSNEELDLLLAMSHGELVK